MNSLPNYKNLKQAQERIAPFIHRTPVLTSSTINQLTGCDVYFKCENFQRTGSFKMRGASNAIILNKDLIKASGVTTHSSGNFAQALALAARKTGIKATVIMPSSASRIKKQAVESYGATIIECEPNLTSREETTNRYILETGAKFIHPYNDYEVIFGQGTAMLEFNSQVKGLDIVFVPVGGGGLISGIALAAKYISPSTTILGVEPYGADDAYKSLMKGKIQPSENPGTIADGLLTSLGDKTFPIIKTLVPGIFRVREEEIIYSMQLIWERLKIIAEPSAAVAFAGLIANRKEFEGKKTGIIISGGNIDMNKLLQNYGSPANLKGNNSGYSD